MAQRQWVSAVEHSSFLFQQTAGIAQQEAAGHLVDALLLSGEEYLAELHLKGMLLYAADDEIHLARWARHRLEQFYTDKEDLDKLASLYAVSLSEKLTPLTCNKLTQILLKQGKEQLALRAALVPRIPYRKKELVLQATLANRWWKLFQSTLARVADKTSKVQWGGLEKLVQNDQVGARQLFAENRAGQDYLQALDEAAAIRAKLLSQSPEVRTQGIANWSHWQHRLPGPRAWKSASRTIYQHAGGALLYSDAQDLHSQLFRSEPDRPVRFRIRGPATISASIRPLHPAGSNEPIIDWALLRSDDELDLIPISNNLPTQQWRLVTDQAHVPGMIVEYQRSFGPGLHDISLAADTVPLLVSLKLLRPVVRDYGLPMDERAITNFINAEKTTLAPVTEADRFSCLKADCLVVLPEQTTKKPRYFKTQTLHEQTSGKGMTTPALNSPHLQTAALSESPADTRSAVARLMAQQRWQEALAHTSTKSPEERAQTLTLLAYLSERHPQQRIDYEVQARSLLSRFPDTDHGTALLRRISSTSRWQQVPFVQGAAGIRLLPFQNWQPEEPSMRIRKALLRQQPRGQTVLTGIDSSVLMMENTDVSRIGLTFNLAELPYLKPESLSIAYQLDENEPDVLHLTPDVPQKAVSLTVPPGRHRLSISILTRFSNQYLCVTFAEEQLVSSQQGSSNPIWSAQSQERAFHVVHPEEPLVATIPGPAWVRVDELTNDTINSTYYHIAEAVQNLVVKADASRPERLVRIFHRVPDTTINGDSLMRTTLRNYQRVLPPLPQPKLDTVSPAQQMLTDLPPPLPEISQSRSAALSFNRRRDLQEDDVSEKAESFTQMDAGIKKFIEELNLYTQSKVFLRIREGGGPTLGAMGDYTWKLPELPLNVRIQAEALAQNPEGSTLDFSNWDPVEWSAKLRVSAYQYRQINLKLTHRPMVSFFSRLLSTEDGGDYEPGSLDQDIYTPYKAEHRSGLQLSEYLSYRPWLDSQFNARAVFALNEDLNLFEPDHLRFAVGWRQLLGSYQLSAAYQYTRFFADEDRDDIVNRNDFTVALWWDPLFNADNWLRFHFKYRFQFETGEHTGMIGLTWYFDGNRSIFHHRPEDDPFNTLRRIRATMYNYRREAQ